MAGAMIRAANIGQLGMSARRRPAFIEGSREGNQGLGGSRRRLRGAVAGTRLPKGLTLSLPGRAVEPVAAHTKGPTPSSGSTAYRSWPVTVARNAQMWNGLYRDTFCPRGQLERNRDGQGRSRRAPLHLQTDSTWQ